MEKEHFILFLRSVLEGMAATETHALMHVSMTENDAPATFAKLIADLRNQVGPDIQYANLLDGNYLVFLHRVTLEEALRAARQLRYSMEHPGNSGDKLNGSLSVVIFDHTKSNVEDLLIVAQQATMVAQAGAQNRIEPVDYTRVIGL